MSTHSCGGVFHAHFEVGDRHLEFLNLFGQIRFVEDLLQAVEETVADAWDEALVQWIVVADHGMRFTG